MGRRSTDTYIKTTRGFPEYVRDVPADVRPVVGKAKWKKSLRGLSPGEAIIEARRLATEHDKAIAAARNGSPLTSSTNGRSPVDLAGGLSGFLDWMEDRARQATLLEDEAESWRSHTAEDGPDDDIADPDWAAANAASLDAERLQIARQLARDLPRLRELGATPEGLRMEKRHYAADAMEANPRNPEAITLSGVVEAWKEQTQPAAPEQYEYPVRLFEELHGALPIRQITVDQVRSFRDALKKMPPASGGKFDGLTMQQAIQFAEAEGIAPLKSSTAGKHFRCFKAMFTFAFDESYVEVNVAAGIKFRPPKEKVTEANKTKRRTFSPDEMVKLFDAAEKPRWQYGDENRWFLRLMTWTGARPEELAQLAPADVREVAGHLCFSLHDEGANRIKNPSSMRFVPVHPHLVAEGFLDFIESREGAAYLFNSLEPKEPGGRRYTKMSRRLARLIDTNISDDPRLVAYSLRHGFKDAMRLAGAPEEIVEQIMGHSNPMHRTGRGYGSAQIAVMAEWIAKADPFDRRRVVSEFDDEEGDDSSVE